jgi:N-acetyl sugar amidotransferase
MDLRIHYTRKDKPQSCLLNLLYALRSILYADNMPSVGKICTRGVWDESVPGIKFDENGVSNYAQLMDKLVEAYPLGEKGKAEWHRILNLIKKSGEGKRYDCIIGVSGGTDSSYLLWLAKEYGLRPLAVNLDNGWSSDISVRNIKKMTDALNIDLFTYVIDYEEIKDLNRCYMKAGLPWVDIPTDLAIKAVLYKIGASEGVKFILRGNDFRSEGTQPREWTYGDGKQLKFIHDKFGKVKLRTFPNYRIHNLIYYSLLKKIKSIYPFYYLEYSKKEAQKFLIEKFGWEYYGGHHFENIFTRFVISYWLYEKFGIDKRKITFSAQIVSGEMNRAESLELLTKKPYDENEKSYLLEYVLKKLDFNFSEFESIISDKNKSYLDYPSDYRFIDSLIYFSGPVLKKVFLHKPQSLFQAEMRNEK